jgi:hypothetical protein
MRKWPLPGKRFFVLTAVVVTISVAGITALQTDAGIRSNRSNRQSQALALDVAEALTRSNLRASYDLDVLRESAEQGVRAASLTLAALQESNPQVAADLMRAAEIAQAKSDALRASSVLYNDPQYAPKEEGAFPDANKYVTQSTAESERLGAEQISASEDKSHWGDIADGYVVALTILAVALFILGLAQALPEQSRLTVGMVGVGISALGMSYALLQVGASV